MGLVSGGKLLDMVLFFWFFSAWIPGLAEAGGLSGCWWACPSVEVDLLVCLDAGCC